MVTGIGREIMNKSINLLIIMGLLTLANTISAQHIIGAASTTSINPNETTTIAPPTNPWYIIPEWYAIPICAVIVVFFIWYNYYRN